MRPIRVETIAWFFVALLLSSPLFWHYWKGVYITIPALDSYLSFFYPSASFPLPFHEPVCQLFTFLLTFFPLSYLHFFGIIALWIFFLAFWILLFHTLMPRIRFVMLATLLLFFFVLLYHISFDAAFFPFLKGLISLSLIYSLFLSVETQSENYFAFGFLIGLLFCGEVAFFFIPYLFFLLVFFPVGKERLKRFWNVVFPFLVFLFILFLGFRWKVYFPSFSFLSLDWKHLLIYLLAIGLLGANWLMLGELNLKMRIRTGAILSLLLFALPFHFLFSHNGFFLILFITAFSLAVVHLVFVIKERRRKSVLWIPYLLILSWGLFHFFYALQPYFALQMANAYRYRTLCKFLSKEEAGVVLTDDLLFSFQCPSRVVLLRRPILSSRTLYDAICEVEPTHLLVQEALLPYLQELWLSYSVVDQFTLPSSNHSRVLLIRIDPSRLSCSHWKGRRR